MEASQPQNKAQQQMPERLRVSKENMCIKQNQAKKRSESLKLRGKGREMFTSQRFYLVRIQGQNFL